MRKLDFLSNSPKTFIFQQSSNKTTFGGFLTMIYIFIVFLIAFTYIYNYYANDKYIISYNEYFKPLTRDEIDEKKKDREYNPTLDFAFDLSYYNDESLSDNFILVDFNKKTILKRNIFYAYNVSELNIGILYKCLDMNCSLQPEDEIINENLGYKIELIHQKFDLNLQDKTQPMVLGNNVIIKNYVFYSSYLQQKIAHWEIIKVKEEKGLFDNFIGNKKEIIGGQLSDIVDEIILNTNNEDRALVNPFELSGIYKLIFLFSINSDFKNYVEYQRKGISVFDIIANICSLSLTIFNGFLFGFSFFYSQNFDNYKIIDKILTSKGKPREKKIRNAKVDKSLPLLNINEMKEIEEKDVDKIKLINETDSEKNEDSLPKYHFFNFIFNIFSCKCCQKNKVQKSITICNNIIERYYSIENLIYNQFMLENLLQDYKWNNPDLNSIKNNELIYKLEQIIKTEGILQ